MRGFRRLAQLRSPTAFVDTFGFGQTQCPRSDRSSRLATAFPPRSGLTTLVGHTTKAPFEDPWRIDNLLNPDGCSDAGATPIAEDAGPGDASDSGVPGEGGVLDSGTSEAGGMSTSDASTVDDLDASDADSDG